MFCLSLRRILKYLPIVESSIIFTDEFMNKLSETYFTIGEFASLFKLSKQTLFYYERNNILRPAYIDENGYRYYSLEQYFIFDIIINIYFK